MNHDLLKLCRDGRVGSFVREHGNEAGPRAFGAACGEDGGAVVPDAAANDNDVAESPFVAGNRAGPGKVDKVFRQRPLNFARQRAGDQPNVRSDFQPACERPGGRSEQALFGCTHRQSDGRFNRRALRFAGVAIKP